MTITLTDEQKAILAELRALDLDLAIRAQENQVVRTRLCGLFVKSAGATDGNWTLNEQNWTLDNGVAEEAK